MSVLCATDILGTVDGELEVSKCRTAAAKQHTWVVWPLKPDKLLKLHLHLVTIHVERGTRCMYCRCSQDAPETGWWDFTHQTVLLSLGNAAAGSPKPPAVTKRWLGTRSEKRRIRAEKLASITEALEL